MFDLWTHNRAAWDRRVDSGNHWTHLGSSTELAAARREEWQIVHANPFCHKGKQTMHHCPQKVCRTLFDTPTFR